MKQFFHITLARTQSKYKNWDFKYYASKEREQARIRPADKICRRDADCPPELSKEHMKVIREIKEECDAIIPVLALAEAQDNAYT